MTTEENRREMRVECDDCDFDKVVDFHGEIQPADVLVEHAKETGHSLSLSRPCD